MTETIATSPVAAKSEVVIDKGKEGKFVKVGHDKQDLAPELQKLAYSTSSPMSTTTTMISIEARTNYRGSATAMPARSWPPRPSDLPRETSTYFEGKRGDAKSLAMQSTKKQDDDDDKITTSEYEKSNWLGILICSLVSQHSWLSWLS